MRAARYYGKNDIRVEDVPTPSIHSSTTCWSKSCSAESAAQTCTSTSPARSSRPTTPHPLTGVTLPQTLGHEFSARVVEIGSDVTDVRVGDRVAIMPAIVCGRCHYCRRGLGHLCVRFACTGLSAETGGLAQYAVLKDYQLAMLPDSVTDLEGAVIEPASVAAYGVDRAGVHGGDVVLVTGAGPIGVLSAMYARAIGASTVVIAEPNPNRSALAPAMDIGPVVDPTDAGFASALDELTQGLGVDLAIESSGSSPGLSTGVRHTRALGSIVQTGLHTKPATLDAMALSENELTLIGRWCYFITDWPRIIRLIASREVPGSQSHHRADRSRERRHRGLRRARQPARRPAQGAGANRS